MEQIPLATFAQMLAELREEIVAADPQAAPSEDAPAPSASSASSALEPNQSAAELVAQADTLSAAFDQAPDEARQEYLLHALDEAIAAIEMASLLAEKQNTLVTTVAATASPTANNPLHEAYQAFVESQPAYQALYHYRNALATRLQRDTRTVPPAVAADIEPPQENEPAH